MPKQKQAGLSNSGGAQADAQPAVSWKQFFAAVCAENLADDALVVLAQDMARDLGARLQVLAADGKLSSHKVFVNLSIGQLNTYLTTMEVDTPSARASLVALNNIIHLSPSALAAALAEHGTVEALCRGLHKRLTLVHELSPMVMLVLHALVLNCEEVYEDLGLLASKQDLVDVVLSTVIWLSNSPDRLYSGQGLATASRAVRICWSLSRQGTAASRNTLGLFHSVDLGSRVLHLCSLPGAEEMMAAAAGSQAAGGAAASASLGELYINVLAVCSSFLSALLGLGGALDARATGLRGLRAWLLPQGRLTSICHVLDVLTAELQGQGMFLAHLHNQQQQAEPVQSSSTGDASSSGESPEAAAAAAAQQSEGGQGSQPDSAATAQASPSGSSSTAAASGSAAAATMVDGALRNMLTVLGVPLLCADPSSPDEINALADFSLRYYHRLFEDKFGDVLKRLGSRDSPYLGPYAAFFRAIADVMLAGINTSGVKFAEWGVVYRQDVSASAGGLRSDMGFPSESGVDEGSAKQFIAETIPHMVVWSQRMRKIIEMSQRALLAGRILPKVMAGQAEKAELAAAGIGQLQLQGNKAGGGSGATSTSTSVCGLCGKSEGELQGVKLKPCPCELVMYCGKTCQLAHFPQHKVLCKVARQQKQAAAAAAQAQAQA